VFSVYSRDSYIVWFGPGKMISYSLFGNNLVPDRKAYKKARYKKAWMRARKREGDMF
jgi:hypothetical protein